MLLAVQDLGMRAFSSQATVLHATKIAAWADNNLLALTNKILTLLLWNKKDKPNLNYVDKNSEVNLKDSKLSMQV